MRLNKLQRYFYERNLLRKKREATEARELINWEDTKHLGILYNSSIPDNDILIAHFAERARAEGKEVEVLGFVADTKTTHKAAIQIFNKKGITWYCAPIAENALAFADRRFDLLLSCFVGDEPPLEYLSCIAKAKWRVGVYNKEKTRCYDFMVNMGTHTELSYFLTQAVTFLNQIHYDAHKI